MDDIQQGSFDLKVGLAEMLKGGVIMDVTTPDEARIAEDAGAVAVIALEKKSTDKLCECSLARMSAPEVIQSIQEAVSIPVITKCRIGHFAEAQILEALFVDFIDECEALNCADEENYIDKQTFKIPFICGASNLGEALRRIAEGAALIRTKGNRNVAEAVRQMRQIKREIRKLTTLDPAELNAEAVRLQAPLELVKGIAFEGQLPVPLFASGGIVTAADAALMMQLGAESVFVDSEIFQSQDPAARAQMLVAAVSHYQDPEVLARVSMGLFEGMKGSEMKKDDLLSKRGW